MPRFSFFEFFIIFLLFTSIPLRIVEATEEEICTPEEEPWYYSYSDEFKKYATIVGGTVAGAAIGGPAVVAGLGAAGFGTGGVASGSLAAWLMSSNVAGGSLYAACQSIGATGAVPFGTSVLSGMFGFFGSKKAYDLFVEEQNLHCECICNCKCPWKKQNTGNEN